MPLIGDLRQVADSVIFRRPELENRGEIVPLIGLYAIPICREVTNEAMTGDGVSCRAEPAPVTLGVILGPLIESNLRLSLLLDVRGEYILFTRPICMVLIALLILTVAVPPVLKKFTQRSAGTPTE